MKYLQFMQKSYKIIERENINTNTLLLCMSSKPYLDQITIKDTMKELVLNVVVRKYGKRYSAWCPELNVASDGDSIEESKQNLKEAAQGLIETMIEGGDLDLLLEKIGLSKKEFKKDRIVSQVFSGTIEVPFSV